MEDGGKTKRTKKKRGGKSNKEEEEVETPWEGGEWHKWRHSFTKNEADMSSYWVCRICPKKGDSRPSTYSRNSSYGSMVYHLATCHMEHLIMKYGTMCGAIKPTNDDLEVENDGAASEKFQEMLTLIGKPNNKGSITINFWKNCEDVYFMETNLFVVDVGDVGSDDGEVETNWKLRSGVLEVKPLLPLEDSNGNGIEVFNAILQVIKNYNLSGKVVGCTYQSTGVYGEAFHKFVKGLKDDEAPFFFFPCLGFHMESCVHDFLASRVSLKNKLEILYSALVLSETRSEFDDLVKSVMVNKDEHLQAIPPSFLRMYTMIKLLAEAKDRVDGLVAKLELQRQVDLNFENQEMKAVFFYNEVLGGFMRVITDIVNNGPTTMGFGIAALEQFIKDQGVDGRGVEEEDGDSGLALIKAYGEDDPDIQDEDEDSGLQLEALKMQERLREFYMGTHTSEKSKALLYLSSLLDPRVSRLLTQKIFQDPKYPKFVKDYFKSKYEAGSSSSSSSQSFSYAWGSMVANDKGKGMLTEEDESEVSEFMKKAAVKGAVRTPLVWWREKRRTYPTLSKLASDFISIQATCKPMEEILCFSMGVAYQKKHRLDSVRAKLLGQRWKKDLE